MSKRKHTSESSPVCPLDSTEENLVGDFVFLLEKALELRRYYRDPTTGNGGDYLSDEEIPLIIEQHAKSLITLERVLLDISKRAGGPLRRLMRPDPDPRAALPAGAYPKLVKQRFVRSESELWQTAVEWTLRAVSKAHAGAHTEVASILVELIDRGRVTSSALLRAHAGGGLERAAQRSLETATSKRAPRGQKFAMHWLASLTGVAVTTIRSAVRRAKADDGTTLHEREAMAKHWEELGQEIDERVRAGTMTLPQPVVRRRRTQGG